MEEIIYTEHVSRIRGSKPLVSRRAVLRSAGMGVALLAALAAGDFGYHYWTVGRFLESTDDAYVKADFTTVAPKVSGYIADVLVADNQPVKAGQVLARIDDRDLNAALDQSRADVTGAGAAIRDLDAETNLQQSVIEEARAGIAATKSGLKFAEQDRARYRDLMRTGYGTVQRAQQTEAILGEKQAQLVHDRAGLAAAQRRIEVIGAERAKAQAALDRARAIEHQAELNLSYATIVAPVDGTVGERAVRVGQYVQAGTQLMAVVPLRAVYVIANFKETQLTHMRNGQPVTIDVDGFPDAKLAGHVDSLAPASGLEFALLPPDNATGNFTKIVQRVPVKILLDNDALVGSLRPGMSVEPTVDTKPITLALR